MRIVLEGISASPGIGIGKVLRYRERELKFNRDKTEDSGLELERYHRAVDKFCKVIEERAELVEESLGKDQAAIIRAHVQMIRDPYMQGQIEGKIAANLPAESALESVMGTFLTMLSGADNEVIRQRAADVRDIRDGMLRMLLGVPEVDLSQVEVGTILAADELTPSVTASIDPTRIAGMITKKGGRTSHSAILARALGIPAVVGVELPQTDLPNGVLTIVDGYGGKVILQPTEEEVQAYLQLHREDLARKLSLKGFSGKKTATKDGVTVRLAANVGTLEDAGRASEATAEGVGLLRSEFLYLDQVSPPDEETQYSFYRKVVESAEGKQVTVRTLDVGEDKEVPYFQLPPEENPFLGFRAVRYSLAEPETFRMQLRAILRAAACGPVDILIPMVTRLQEIRQVKEQLALAKQELQAAGIPYGEKIRLGMMVETCAAVFLAEQFAAEVDFFSIGTNDLTQYVLAVDRGNPKVASIYSYFDPALLQALKKVTEAAAKAGIPVGLCGEAASDPLMTPVLLSLRLATFSVPPPSLLLIRREISLWTMEEADAVGEKVFSLSTEEEVRTYLQSVKKTV
jgi:phosphotransferase system enzyme I (PtsI)